MSHFLMRFKKSNMFNVVHFSLLGSHISIPVDTDWTSKRAKLYALMRVWELLGDEIEKMEYLNEGKTRGGDIMATKKTTKTKKKKKKKTAKAKAKR